MLSHSYLCKAITNLNHLGSRTLAEPVGEVGEEAFLVFVLKSLESCLSFLTKGVFLRTDAGKES